MGLLRLAKGACGKNPVLIHSQLHTHTLSLFPILLSPLFSTFTFSRFRTFYWSCIFEWPLAAADCCRIWIPNFTKENYQTFQKWLSTFCCSQRERHFVLLWSSTSTHVDFVVTTLITLMLMCMEIGSFRND